MEYRAYLERYPDGPFAPLAEARIRSLEQGEVPIAVPGAVAAAIDPRAIELAFWETIKDSTNPEMYRAYLQKYPSGEFAPVANAKLVELP